MMMMMMMMMMMINNDNNNNNVYMITSAATRQQQGKSMSKSCTMSVKFSGSLCILINITLVLNFDLDSKVHNYT